MPLTPDEDLRLRRAGCPVVSFGFGGQMITMIPRTPHRVHVRRNTLLPVPGPINFTSLRGIVDPPGLAASFPGPLFMATKPVKGKTKEILAWLDCNLATLDQVRESRAFDEESVLHIEDRKVLYTIVKLLAENNGVLDASPEVEKKVLELLMPHTTALPASDQPSFGVTASALSVTAAAQTVVDPGALATYNLTTDFLRSIRKLLMQGDRQGAIRKAIDQKMWGHALLIASSISPIVWRDTAEHFIRSELRDTGSKDFDSLRFLYGVLAGEGVDAANELLPPMNRMISSIQTSAVSQGPRFTSWKESLGMILANKTPMENPTPIIGLGMSLIHDGRIEAGHSWYANVFQN
jgi:COPII coat assembly protein SEC16